MSLSSVDIANATASDAGRKAEDLVVMVGWLQDRLAALEAIAGVQAPARPELPSERMQRLMMEFYAAERHKMFAPEPPK